MNCWAKGPPTEPGDYQVVYKGCDHSIYFISVDGMKRVEDEAWKDLWYLMAGHEEHFRDFDDIAWHKSIILPVDYPPK